MARWWQAVAILLGGPLLGVLIGGVPDFSREPEAASLTTRAGEGEGDSAPAPPAGESGPPPAAPNSPPTTAAPAVRPPAQVKVRVYLAATVAGAGTNAVNKLRPAGFAVLEPAWAPKDQPATTRVFFDPGFDREAQAVAAALGVPAAVAPMPAGLQVELTEEPDVIVLAGNDLAPR